MMKRLLVLLLALCLCLVAAACGAANEEGAEEMQEESQEGGEDKPRFVPDGDAFYQMEQGLVDLNRFSFETIELDPAPYGAARAVEYDQGAQILIPQYEVDEEGFITIEPDYDEDDEDDSDDGDEDDDEDGTILEYAVEDARILFLEFAEDSPVLAQIRETGILEEDGVELEVDVHDTMPLVIYCNDPEDYWLVLFIFDSIVPE